MIKFIPITVDSITSTEPITKEFVKELDKVGSELKKDLLQPTETWEEKPTFQQTIEVSPQKISIDTYLAGDTPGNQHYEWLDEGVADHEVSSDTVHMKLPKTFSPKTMPGTLVANAGARSEESTFIPRDYPLIVGIDPRNFINTEAEILGKKFHDSAIRIMRNVEQILSE